MQTALQVPRIQRLGHQVGISCCWGLDAGVMAWGEDGSIPCYPKGVAADSQDVIAPHAAHFGADAVVTLYDAWTFDPGMFHKPWVPYFPVDMEPVARGIVEKIQHAPVRVAMARNGQRLTEAAGLECDYVPHCYDAAMFYPDDPTPARKYLDAEDRFVIGVVAANKGTPGAPHRKSLVQIVQGFKEFHRHRDDALLYLHSYSRSNMGGIDLQGLCAYYELPEDSVRIADAYTMYLGVPTEMMRGLYSAMDVLLSPSMGEGFGVPIVEAQACGTPVIAGDWTAMTELTLTGYAIPKTDAFEYYWPGWSNEWIVYPAAVTAALEEAYDWRYDRFDVAAKVVEYEADHVVETYWPPVLEKIQRVIDADQPVQPNRAARRRMKIAGAA